MTSLRFAATAAFGFFALTTAPAFAADLGGSCCSDLEERIAELEATTARKGNRKVSLNISGWVNQQLTRWSDGAEQDTYVHDVGSTLGSHVKFTGAAAITSDWSAGYHLQFELINSDGLTIDQDTPRGPAALGGAGGVQTLQSYWFVRSETLGKLSVGKLSQASDNAAILVDQSGSLVSANWVSFDINSFFIRDKSTGVLTSRRWGEAGGCVWGDCNGVPLNAIRYDTPSFGGFSLSASWGEDDFWDIAARHASEHAGFKISFTAAYSESTDKGVQGSNGIDKTRYFQAGGYLEHVETGLFGVVNYGNFDNGIAGAENADTWWMKGGLRRKWMPLGHTIVYGEYLENQDGGNTGSQLEVWGLGMVQEIDAAAMSLWMKMRNASVSGLQEGGAEFEAADFRWVGFGALINF